MEITVRQFEIIEATGKILTLSGVSGLTIKNLAKEMNFSESAIYRHFASKEEIIICLLNFMAQNMDERYSLICVEKISSESKFIKLFQNQFEFFKKSPHFVVVVFSDGLMEESQKINQAILAIMNVKMKHLKPIISDAQNTGIFTKAISTDDLIHIIMGSFRLQMFKWRVSNFEFDILEKGNILIESILTLIKTKNEKI